MFNGDDWITDWHSAETFSLRMGEICSTIPLRGSWEPNDRIAFTMASFRLAQEHHSAIHLLGSHKKYASANALARPLLEAALRTIWIAEDAGDKEIEKLTKNRGSLPLLGSLNKCLGKRGRPLSGRFQDLLHSFTHGGPDALGAQFLDGERLERLNALILALSGFALGGAGYSASRMLGRQDLLELLDAATPDF